MQALYRPSVCALPRPIVTPSALLASAAVTSAHGLSVPAEAADASTRAAVAATSSERIARRLAERAPKAKLLEVRLERARLEAGLRFRRVVATGRDVVRCVGVEERSKHLDLAAPDAELELAAAVERDPVLLTALVELEQAPNRPEARGLAVEASRRERQRLDVGPGMDRSVPGDAIAVRLEYGISLGRECGILDPRVAERLGDATVQLGVGRVVDRGAVVLALQIDDVDDVAGHELRDHLVRPIGGRVELESQVRVELEPRIQRRSAGGRDEANGLWLALERRGDVRAVRLQRIVERGRLERPAAVVAERRQRGLAVREELELVQVCGEGLEGPVAAEVDPGEPRRLVLARVVGDVLTEAVVELGPPAHLAAKVHGRRPPLKLRRDRHHRDVHRYVGHLERQLLDLLPEHC